MTAGLLTTKELQRLKHMKIIINYPLHSIVRFLFAQVLQLNQTTLARVTSGYVIDLVAGDVHRFDRMMLYVGNFLGALLEVFGVTLLTWWLLGYQALGGIAFLVLQGIYYVLMGRILSSLRFKIAKVTEKRLNSMKAIVPGIRAVKMHAWEWPFLEVVTICRR